MSSVFARAKAAYSSAGILGFSEKDVIDQSCATVSGAEVDSSEQTRSLDLVLVGPPRAKRIALAAISLELARLLATSDFLHLCIVGGWVSGMLYRRPLMSVLNAALWWTLKSCRKPTQKSCPCPAAWPMNLSWPPPLCISWSLTSLPTGLTDFSPRILPIQKVAL